MPHGLSVSEIRKLAEAARKADKLADSLRAAGKTKNVVSEMVRAEDFVPKALLPRVSESTKSLWSHLPEQPSGRTITLEELRAAENEARAAFKESVGRRSHIRSAKRKSRESVKSRKPVGEKEILEGFIRERDRKLQEYKYWEYHYNKARERPTHMQPRPEGPIPPSRAPRIKYEASEPIVGEESTVGRAKMVPPAKPEKPPARSIHEGMAGERTVSAVPLASSGQRDIFGVANQAGDKIYIQRSVDAETARKRAYEAINEHDRMKQLVEEIQEAGGYNALLAKKRKEEQASRALGITERATVRGPGGRKGEVLYQSTTTYPNPRYAGGWGEVNKLRGQLADAGDRYKVAGTGGNVTLVPGRQPAQSKLIDVVGPEGQTHRIQVKAQDPGRLQTGREGIQRAGTKQKAPEVSLRVNEKTGKPTHSQVLHGEISRVKPSFDEWADVQVRERKLSEDEIQRYLSQLEGFKKLREQVPKRLRGGYDERIRQLEFMLYGGGPE